MRKATQRPVHEVSPTILNPDTMGETYICLASSSYPPVVFEIVDTRIPECSRTTKAVVGDVFPAIRAGNQLIKKLAVLSHAKCNGFLEFGLCCDVVIAEAARAN